MLLAVDIGNTNTVFALFHGKDFQFSWRMRSESDRTADEYAVFLRQILNLHGHDLSVITHCLVSSVVPDAIMSLRLFLRGYLDIDPLVIGQDNIKTYVEIAVDKPEEVGADRIVNAAAVKFYYPMPAVVIDLGTATTFDVVDAEGRFCGGVIAPGINLSLNALHAAAAKLPKISVRKPPSAIGRNTVDAMQSGLYFGYVSLIDGMLTRIEREIGVLKSIILTGGLAPVLMPDLSRATAIDEDLTLKGLMLIAHNNKGMFRK